VNPTYIVEKEATLRGKGKIQKGTITIQQGGSLQAGDTLINKSVFDLTGTTTTLKNGSMLTIPVSYENGIARSNSVKVGTLTIEQGAILKMDMQISAAGVPNDTRFQVFSDKGEIIGTFDTLEPAAPSEEQEWDLEELYDNGCIYVREKGYSQDRPTYKETNLFADSEQVAADGFYYFTAENDAQTQQYVNDSIITFDTAGKASLNTTYATDQQTGAIKLSKSAEVTFHTTGDVCSLKLALYRASGTDWGYVYASTDGEDWVLLKSLTSDLTLKQTNYVDLTLDGMKALGYRQIKIMQPNGTSPTYLSGIALTYMKKEEKGEGIEQISLDLNDDKPAHDLMGRTVNGTKAGQVLLRNARAYIIK